MHLVAQGQPELTGVVMDDPCGRAVVGLVVDGTGQRPKERFRVVGVQIQQAPDFQVDRAAHIGHPRLV